MIAEALKYLSEQAQKATAPVQLPIDDPREVTFIVAGKRETKPLPPEPRNHQVDSLEDLIGLANRFSEGDNLPVVWYDESNVVLVIDDAGHRVETARFPLSRSSPFERLGTLAHAEPLFDQKPFVRLLRIDLADTGEETARLVESVRRVKFENGVTVSGQVARGRESLGREITSKVESLSAPLPELVTLEVPIYRNPGERDRYPVRCAVEVDPALGKFQLIPLPDELDRVVQLHLADVHDRLAAGLNAACLYAGRP